MLKIFENSELSEVQKVRNKFYAVLKKNGYGVQWTPSMDIMIDVDNDFDYSKQIMEEIVGILENNGVKVSSGYIKKPNARYMTYGNYDVDVLAFPSDVCISIY